MLQDTVSGGLDVPAGDQVIVDVVLVLNDDGELPLHGRVGDMWKMFARSHLRVSRPIAYDDRAARVVDVDFHRGIGHPPPGAPT